MSELLRLAEEAVYWTLVLDAVKEHQETARRAVEIAMADQKTLQQQVTDAAGDELGTVSRSRPKWSASVTDPAALHKWVTEHRPDELVSQVRASYVAALLAEAISNASDPEGVGPYPYDPTTGEIIPGVEARRTTGTLTIRKTDIARARVRDLVASRMPLSVEGVPDALA